MALRDYFNTTVTVEKVTRISNGFGGFEEIWQADFELDCVIDLLVGMKQREISNQYLEDSSHILMCEAEHNVTDLNRINDNGDIYRVIMVDTPFKSHGEIYLQKVGVDNV
jgi:hypothetical protein